MTVSVESRIWIEKNGKPFLGSGRVKLLESISRFGSISKAATELNMSYKKAWLLIKSINEQADKPVVLKESGGKHGGGSILTAQGEELIKKFRELEQSNHRFLDNELIKCCIE